MGRVPGVARPLAGVALLVLGSALAGCGVTPDRSEVVGTATGFVTAVMAKDGAHACALLTPRAAESASGATGVSCHNAVLGVDESGTKVRSVQVWGDAGQVAIGSDVLFLRRLSTGWRVSAAGCSPQPGTAYDCDVEG